MSHETLITDLLRLWEQQRYQGKELPLEEVCRDHPDLLEELRFRVRLLESMDRRFAGPGPHGPTLDAAATKITGPRPSLLQPGHEPIAGYRLVEGLGRGG